MQPDNREQRSEPEYEKPDSLTKQLSKWFFNDDEDKLFAEARLLWSHQSLNITRIVFIVVLTINCMWRMIYTSIDDKFLKDQLYFTTWWYYITVYVLTCITLTSYYFKEHEFNYKNKWHVRFLRHNNLVFFIMLWCQWLVFLIYYTMLVKWESPEISISIYIDHLIPLVALIIDFILVGYVFRWTYVIPLILYTVVLYMPVTYFYSENSDDDLYKILSWDSPMTLVWIIICTIIVLTGYGIFLSISIYRYKKHLRKNQGERNNQENIPARQPNFDFENQENYELSNYQ